MRKPFIAILTIAVLGLLIVFSFKKVALSPEKKDQSSQQQIGVPSFDKTKFSLTDPNSLWVVVNKQHPLSPVSYVPNDLIAPSVSLRLAATAEQMQVRKTVEEPLRSMFADAQTAGFTLTLGSGFRSYALQKQFYNGYVSNQGQAEADRTSARPGYSEHQTGLSLDVGATGGKCHLDKCLGEMPDGKWIAANAYKYGFIVRYPNGKEDITGYDYEPWHLRYIGPELAAELNKQSITTLEEFFGVSGGKSY